MTAAAKSFWYTHAELRDLASDSLNLLKSVIYDERFPALFDLDVYGSIVGMFELNNLGVCHHSLTRLEAHICLKLCARHERHSCVGHSRFVGLHPQPFVVQSHADLEV